MKFKIGVCQPLITVNRDENIKNAFKAVESAADMGAKAVLLPEIFTVPYTRRYVRNFPEADGSLIKEMGELAKKKGIYFFAGTIPEAEGEKIYNTCFIYNPKGEIIGKYRKMHLFDTELEGLNFKESLLFESGNTPLVLDTELGKIGVAVCFDIRFAEYMVSIGLKGVNLIMVPSEFGIQTGGSHWQILARLRALDAQAYFAGAISARNPDGPFIAYGHSVITDPWGDIVGELDEKEGVLVREIDTENVKRIRKGFPLLKGRKPELYL
ncbi:MAG: nitrilase-related carbon-nitrogen hydrolase [Lachnospiraceae bacterium]|nr:nitrilase-related carbon-nitrogen hydrolase [Lachnospiraceae bacterium]